MSLLDRLRSGLSRTREVMTTPLEDLVRGRRPLDAHSLEAVEEALLAADMGVPAVEEAMETLRLVYRIYCADKAWQSAYGLCDDARA